MAGRPVNLEERECKKRELDHAVAALQERRLPVTRKSLASELGISVQNFYKPKNGKLSFIAEYAESLDVFEKRPPLRETNLEAELNRLKSENERLKKENAKIRDRDKLLQAQIKTKDEMIDALTMKVDTLEGYKFQQQKYEFINSRI